MLTQLERNPSQRTVLYIEDNLPNLALVEELIERRSDLTLLSAVTGLLGIQLASDHLPDVILMDINLPDINGLDALKRLRENPATAGIPVMALSSDAYANQIRDGIAAGFFQYLTKPFEINAFMAALDACLIASSEIHQL